MRIMAHVPSRRDATAAATLCVIALASMLAAALAFPGLAHATVKRGDLKLVVDSAVSLDCGTSAALNCAVSPDSERQRPCCSTDYCPSGCELDGGAGCLDDNGFCTCLGGSYHMVYANCSVTSSAPNVARASWSAGVLTVKGYEEGSATITVTAKMSLWTSATAKVNVTVGPPAGGSGEGDGTGDGVGSGSGEDSGAQGGEGSTASSGSTQEVVESAEGGDAGAVAPSGDNQATSSPSTSVPSAQPASEPVEESPEAVPKSAGVTASAVSTASKSPSTGGKTGKSGVVSIGENAQTTPEAPQDLQAADAGTPEVAAGEAASSEVVDEPQPQSKQADTQAVAADAVEAVEAVQTAGHASGPVSPLGGAVVGTMAALAVAGSTVRYRMNVRQREDFELHDDESD